MHSRALALPWYADDDFLLLLNVNADIFIGIILCILMADVPNWWNVDCGDLLLTFGGFSRWFLLVCVSGLPMVFWLSVAGLKTVPIRALIIERFWLEFDATANTLVIFIVVYNGE